MRSQQTFSKGEVYCINCSKSAECLSVLGLTVSQKSQTFIGEDVKAKG